VTKPVGFLSGFTEWIVQSRAWALVHLLLGVVALLLIIGSFVDPSRFAFVSLTYGNSVGDGSLQFAPQRADSTAAIALQHQHERVRMEAERRTRHHWRMHGLESGFGNGNGNAYGGGGSSAGNGGNSGSSSGGASNSGGYGFAETFTTGDPYSSSTNSATQRIFDFGSPPPGPTQAGTTLPPPPPPGTASLQSTATYQYGLDSGTLKNWNGGSALAYSVRQQLYALRAVSNIFDVYVSVQNDRGQIDSDAFSNATVLTARCLETARNARLIGDYLLQANNALVEYSARQPHFSDLPIPTTAATLCSALDSMSGRIYFLELVCVQNADMMRAAVPPQNGASLMNDICRSYAGGASPITRLPLLTAPTFSTDQCLSLLARLDTPTLNSLFFQKPLKSWPDASPAAAAWSAMESSDVGEQNVTRQALGSATSTAHLIVSFYEEADSALEICAQIASDDRFERRLATLETLLSVSSEYTSAGLWTPHVSASQLQVVGIAAGPQLQVRTWNFLLCIIGAPGIYLILSLLYYSLINALGFMFERCAAPKTRARPQNEQDQRLQAASPQDEKPLPPPRYEAIHVDDEPREAPSDDRRPEGK
jgi:hypothetical protein